ncbi:Imidazole glycerol phosphate synthase amidotransferase subunit [hydrothermal vent metagenome]|uniref:Imidazole glycerol phosphate synthase amidotransferase subunit n=1 Tax=hydrothermal vent metagenome TaxID=652676 RepID=A0A3B1C5M7_9ZZZZ
MSVVIVDYDVGNLRSVQKAFERVGASAVVERDAEKISSAKALVLPGVGAFAECMNNLRGFGLLEAVKDFISSGRPFLGICVGYQLLFEKSEEFGDSTGLGVFKGKCVKFKTPASSGHKIPHMGWNQVENKNKSRLLEGIEDGSDFYFVHSYYPVPEEDIVTSQTEYGEVFASSVERGNIFATQFHPEKSQRVGLKVLKNFARITG